MDQEMEADEFFPDKLMSEPDVASEWSNDQTIGDDVSKGEGGESALNGDEEVGKGAEEMETDEPVSMQGEDMEMAGESAEPANDLEELAKEVEIPGNGASDSELSLIDDSGEQEVSDKEENTSDSQNVFDDNLDLEAGKPDVDGAGNNIGNDNLDSLEKSNENAIILSESQEISNINESEELNRNDDDVLDLEEPLVEDKNIIDTQDIAEGRGEGEGSTEEISQTRAPVEDTGDVTQESVSNKQEDNEFGDGVEHIAEDSDSKSNQDASASNLAEENTEQEKEDEDLNEDELLGANEDDKDYQGEEQSVVEAGANSGSVIKDQDESSLDLNQESDQATEEVSKEMIPDKANDGEDLSNSEEGETEDEAVHRSSTKSPEQRSTSSEKDLTEVSEIANQSETTPSADNSSQPDNVMQSEATPSADNSNQSEADSQSEVTPSADNSNQSEADSQSEVTPSGDNSNQSAAVSQSETTPPGDNSNQSEAVSQSEVTPSGDNSNQSEGTSNRKSPSFDMSSVKIKKERMDSTESDKANESENSNTGSSNLKIVGVTSAVGVEDKGDHSEQTSENASAKGDNAEEKKTTKNNEVNEQVKVKQESLAAATATEKEDIKKIVNEELKKKIKQESKAKEDEDDDVIAIKEEKKPVPKPKPSKIQTCIVCGKVGKCKYNIVRNGDVKHLCDDTCFKRFRSSPTTYLKQAEGISQAQSKPDQQTNSKPAPTPLKNTAPVKAVPNQQASFQQQSQVYKTCTVCQLMNVRTSKPFLNWQGLDFCGEECLGKYQGGLSNNCSYCSGAIFPNNKAKFCCRVGNEVKHFCSTNCNNDYVKRMKLCAFCNKDLAQSTDSFMAPVGETFKDFCSQNCLQKFEEKNNKDVEIVGVQKGQKASKAPKGNFICAVCGKVGPVKHEFKLDSKVNRLCSDPCFSAFQYANKLTLNTCDNCGTNLNSENQAPQYVQFEGQQRRFCSFMCVNTFRNTNKKTVPCAWCGNKKSNFDMIERVDANNKYQLFCSLNCLSLYRVNLQATSNQAVTCDQCRKFVPAQYHLTMSDASVRNFCSYGCVMQFQAQFQAPAKQVPHQNSVNNAVNAGKGVSPAQQQQQQQTTTRSGRVVTKAPKVAAAAQQQPAGKARATKKDGDSFPIISNVVSLAPQGTQQQINIKSSTPVTVTNQQQGIKATTTTTGNQTVQQQIIIQPPPPISVKNKSLLCKPFTQTKATSCRPHTQIKEVQTEGKSEPEKYLIPVPVPLYCPTPLAMYSVPVPVPFPVPVPVPVPVFIPTTKKSANSILKQIKEIREKIPADPLEAELLMMAEAVAGKDEESSSSSEEEDNTAPPVKETSTAPAASSSGGGDLGEDMLQMALRMASEMTDEPVMDLENSLEPVAVNTEPPAQPKPVVPPPQPVEEDDEYMPSSARSRRSRGGNKRQSRSTPRRNPKRQKVEITPQYHEATPSPPAPAAPPPDANFHLKYTYGVNAFKHWVIQKNSQIEQASKPGHGKNLKTFKTDILQCTADELNYSLCLFVKEVRKPNGEEYAVDSIYYLCLGIQQYLFENGRIDNIFTDFYYERFTEGLNEILTRYEPKLNHAGQLVCRIEEEHLWESKQLGAHSPHVLLNSLVYFNTKYFMLKTSEDHLKLSFTHIMKHWKKTATGRGSGTGPNAGRSVYLRYYCPTPQGKDNQKKKKEEMPVYEQTENLDNPLRCPVKLYEFYLSKCPESIKNRNDTFYLVPERSCVPDSPVWYSTGTLGIDHMAKMLNRIRLVREIQEAHLHTQPIYI
ncbi:zinc finger MYM-type protein 3-like isoform X5 [Mercenaria mercenaria]|uniref:zinc finger MYM-type protein 3-like isoform X5 n=1 Tax=Mercenaria mercenaria TaxID=6596 RepID=UPI00234F508B|nr:zinc finger MYM-type protein 3-like isoform X5 [Mercenaria mercenaria]